VSVFSNGFSYIGASAEAKRQLAKFVVLPRQCDERGVRPKGIESMCEGMGSSAELNLFCSCSDKF
jgi:hypothetical protein